MKRAPLVLCLLTLATLPVSQAMYIATPLRLSGSAIEGKVGDVIDYSVTPENGSSTADWAGRTVRVVYSWDTAEGAEGLESPPNDTYVTRVAVEALTLDDGAEATFSWTVPDEVDDRNVDLKVLSEDGEILAIADLRVGDAEPRMRIMAGEPSGGMPGEPVELRDETDEGAQGATPTPLASSTPERSNGVPGPGLLFVALAAGLVAILARRR